MKTSHSKSQISAETAAILGQPMSKSKAAGAPKTAGAPKRIKPEWQKYYSR